MLVINIFLDVIKQVNKGHLRHFDSHVVIKSLSVQEWIALRLTQRDPHLLVSAGKALLRANAVLYFVFVSFLGPHLMPFVVSAQKVSSNLVVNYAHDATLPVFTRQSNVHFVLSVFGVIRDTRRRYLSRLEVDAQRVSELEFINITLENALCFLLADDFAFRLEVRSF